MRLDVYKNGGEKARESGIIKKMGGFLTKFLPTPSTNYKIFSYQKICYRQAAIEVWQGFEGVNETASTPFF